MRLKVENNELHILEIERIEYMQLKLETTRKIDNYRFHPKVKAKIWDGSIAFLKGDRLPIGFWRFLKDFCKKHDFPLVIEGLKSYFNNSITREEIESFCNELMKNHPIIKPYDYQIDAVYRLIYCKKGLVELATGSGKSLVAYMLMSYMLNKLDMDNILVIVPSVSLVNQLTSDFKEYRRGLNIENDKGMRVQEVYSNSKYTKRANIVIGTYQSLVKNDPEYFSKFDAVIIDEVHGAKNDSTQKIIAMIETITKSMKVDSYMVGVTGTMPPEESVNYLTLVKSFGPVLMKLMAHELIDRKLATKIKVNIINIRYLANDKCMAMYESIKANPLNKKTIFDMERTLVQESEPRLEAVVDLVHGLENNTLVLFHNKDYGKLILDRLKASNSDNKEILYVDGDMDAESRKYIIESMKVEGNKIAVCSFGTFSTGINIKAIFNIVFTQSFKAETVIVQSIGRGLRLFEGKSELNIYDLVDDFCYYDNNGNVIWVNYHTKHSHDRCDIYQKQKYPYSFKNIKLK